MTNDWIIDVLVDLKKFSAANELGDLAEQLDDTILVATTEMLSSRKPERLTVGNSEQTGEYARGAVQSENA